MFTYVRLKNKARKKKTRKALNFEPEHESSNLANLLMKVRKIMHLNNRENP
jgi:hypothetical protein